MTTKTQKAAATLGRIKSEAKTSTARENGKRGGRPAHRYYRLDNGRVCEGGDYWDVTFLAVRPDGSGYIIQDSFQADGGGTIKKIGARYQFVSNSKGWHLTYIDGRKRKFPDALRSSVDATNAFRNVPMFGYTVADWVREGMVSVAELIDILRKNNLLTR